jgi:carbonic anhydrase
MNRLMTLAILISIFNLTYAFAEENHFSSAFNEPSEHVEAVAVKEVAKEVVAEEKTPAPAAVTIVPETPAVAAPVIPTAPAAPTRAVAEAPKAESKAESKREVGPVSAEASLHFLINGNKRFTTRRFRNDGTTKSDLERLSSGQKPHAIVLSCSDSRVPPEIVFDQKLGEIFVVRTAGETLDSSAIASIEYAVSHLGSNLIVVMGHESCGAVKAALATLNGGDAGSPSLNKLVGDIHPRLQRFSRMPASAGVLEESWANVEGVATDLRARSEIIQKAMESGELHIEKALYHLGSGSVEWK